MREVVINKHTLALPELVSDMGLWKLMEAVCWKLKGFSRTFVNDIKEAHVADMLVYN